MVLNTPHDSASDDDLSWEMVIDVVEVEEELRLVVDGDTQDDGAAAGGGSSEVGTQTEGVTIIPSYPPSVDATCWRHSLSLSLGQDASMRVTISDGDTFISGVSSITAEQYHHPSSISACISDVDDDDDDENGKGESDPLLVEQLLSMGFEKAQIMEVISNLHSTGVTDIDANMIIGKMIGDETTTAIRSEDDNNCPLEPLFDVWEHVGSTARVWDDRGRLFVRQRVVGQVQAIGRSAREAWTNAFLSGNRYEGDDLDYDVSDNRYCSTDDSSATTTQFRQPTTLAKSAFFRGVTNEDNNNRIIKGVMAVAIVGSATLLALGNPRASLGAMAVTGAGIAAGEAIRMHHSSEQACTSSTSSPGRGLHLD
jgi:hypothetical protein